MRQRPVPLVSIVAGNPIRRLCSIEFAGNQSRRLCRLVRRESIPAAVFDLFAGINPGE